MAEKMSIYQKLQKCRVELAAKNLKKSGKNKHSGYSYYELGDFLPTANEIMLANGLTALFKPDLPDDNIATLTIINLDNVEEKLLFSSNVAVAKLSGVQEIQNIGATQTYMRRYLYTMAFEIAESDAIEPVTGQPVEDKLVELTFEDVSRQKIGFGKHKGKTLLDIFERHPDYVAWYLENGTDEKIKNSFEVIDRHMHAEMDFEKPVDETKIATIKGLLAKTDSTESDFLKFYKLERLEDMTIDTFTRAMKALEKKLEKTNYAGTPFEDLPI